MISGDQTQALVLAWEAISRSRHFLSSKLGKLLMPVRQEIRPKVTCSRVDPSIRTGSGWGRVLPSAASLSLYRLDIKESGTFTCWRGRLLFNLAVGLLRFQHILVNTGFSHPC